MDAPPARCCPVRFAVRFVPGFTQGDRLIRHCAATHVCDIVSFCAPLYATPRQFHSLVDSIGVVLFLIVPVATTGTTLITIKIDRDKLRADFASVLASPRLAIRRAELQRDASRVHI